METVQQLWLRGRLITYDNLIQACLFTHLEFFPASLGTLQCCNEIPFYTPAQYQRTSMNDGSLLSHVSVIIVFGLIMFIYTCGVSSKVIFAV